MDLNQQKEQFSLAYVHAVAACAGYQLELPSSQRDGIDGHISSDIGLSPIIQFQAKSSARDLLRDDGVHFPLPITNFRTLQKDTKNKRILIVVMLPEDPAEWMLRDNKQLCLRGSGYWVSVRDQDDSANKETVTVLVPSANPFDIDQLRMMMQQDEVGDS